MKQLSASIKRHYMFILLAFISPITARASDNTIIIPEAKLNSKKTFTYTQNKSLTTLNYNRDQIAKSPDTTLSGFFRREQSVIRLTNNSLDSSQTALSLRGFGDNAVANSLILIDGFPLTNPSLLAPQFNAIPLADIDHIEIIQGSAGSLWGDQAVGGVINIVTKHPNKLFASATLGLGSYSENYYNLLFADKAANGLFFKSFGALGKTRNERDHNQQSADNIAAQVGYDYAKGTVSFNAQSYTNSINFPGGLTAQQFLANPRQATSFDNDSYYKTTLLQLLSKHEFNANWRLETRIAHQETIGNGFIFYQFTRNDATTSFSPRLISNWYNNKIIFGYDGQTTHYQMLNTLVQAKTNTTQQNIYSQVVIPLLQQLDVTLGARAAQQREHIMQENTVDSLDHVFVTEQGITYHPSNELSFYLRRDGNFSFPKANEETWLPSNVSSLRPQTGTSYEAGGEYQTEKQKIQASIYHLVLHNELAYDPTETALQPFGAFSNLNTTLRDGVTLTDTYALTQKATLNGQINFVNARFASGPTAGDKIPTVPAANGNIGFDYAWTQHWQTRYALLYTGSSYPSSDVYNIGTRVPGYWLNDVAIQYFFKPMTISFEANNIFNHTYANYVAYNSDTNTNIYYPALGRNYLLTCKIDID